MKKIALIMMITALSVFMFAAVVSSDGNGWKRFHGVYEMTAKTNGLISTCGYKEGGPPYVANDGDDCRVWATADTAYGTWIFKRDGKGTAEGRNFAFDFPPGPPGVGPRARDNDFYFEFEYEITRAGEISVWVTFPEGLTSLEMEGMVSTDHKTITLNNAYTFFNPNTIFMGSRVLIRIGKNAIKD
jgi:hypothetical protein